MTAELYPTNKPKILLVNFDATEELQLKEKGYNVERGWVSGTYHFFPSPGYEYDIVVAKFNKQGYDAARIISSYGESDNEDAEQLTEKINSGKAFALVFTESGDFSDENLAGVGIDSVYTEDLDSRDTQYRLVDTIASERDGHSFTLGILDRVKADIERPIPKGIEWSNNPKKPILRLAHNAANKDIAAIGYINGSYFDEKKRNYVDTFTTSFVILPPVKKGYVRIATDYLSQLPNWRPDLFPKDANFEWLRDEKYFSTKLIEADKIIKKEEEDFRRRLENLEDEYSKYESEDALTKLLLIADDSDDFKEGAKLTDAVKSALEYFGFEVKNNEKETIKGRRREDLLVTDGPEFKALTECKGTVSGNPPESYAFQLLAHMAVRSVSRGILVVNHDRKRDAFQRGPLYEDTPHIWEDSETITVVSTADLFRLVRAVQSGILLPGDAKELIKKPGRLIYKTP